MKRRSMSVLLLALTVVLLLIVSSRVSPGEAYGGGNAAPGAEDAETTRNPAITETTAEAPKPDVKLRELFPDVSLSDWNLKLINNTYVATASFVPSVTEVRDGESFDSRAAAALEKMLSAAEDAGYTVCVRNGYRSYQNQAYLFFGRAWIIHESENIEYETAEQMARSIVAYPGTSDHQTGLGVDIMDSRDTEMTAEEVEDLPLLAWLREHCAEYGFVLRFPKEKQELTGWYKPWHFRYVGEEIAAYLMENDLCLEEFYQKF